MPEWTRIQPDIQIFPGKNKSVLRLFRQSQHDGDVRVVSPATIRQVQNTAVFCVADAIKKTRNCLVALTGSPESLMAMDKYLARINSKANSKNLKTWLDKLIFNSRFPGLKSKKKRSLLHRFFGEKSADILRTMDDGVGGTRRKFSYGMVFRNCLMSTIIGINLQLQSLVLGLSDYGDYGDSITNWGQWKAGVAAPGLDLSRANFATIFQKGLNAIGEGFLRCNVRYLLHGENISEFMYVPGMVLRNSDFFVLTFLHESCHLFTGVGDNYYFENPWDNNGITCGEDNPDMQFGAKRKPKTERCVVNADSYAWFIYLLG